MRNVIKIITWESRPLGSPSWQPHSTCRSDPSPPSITGSSSLSYTNALRITSDALFITSRSPSTLLRRIFNEGSKRNRRSPFSSLPLIALALRSACFSAGSQFFCILACFRARACLRCGLPSCGACLSCPLLVFTSIGPPTFLDRCLGCPQWPLFRLHARSFSCACSWTAQGLWCFPWVPTVFADQHSAYVFPWFQCHTL